MADRRQMQKLQVTDLDTPRLESSVKGSTALALVWAYPRRWPLYDAVHGHWDRDTVVSDYSVSVIPNREGWVPDDYLRVATIRGRVSDPWNRYAPIQVDVDVREWRNQQRSMGGSEEAGTDSGPIVMARIISGGSHESEPDVDEIVPGVEFVVPEAGPFDLSVEFYLWATTSMEGLETRQFRSSHFLEDWMVASIGDSYSSGEGLPDSAAIVRPEWRCSLTSIVHSLNGDSPLLVPRPFGWDQPARWLEPRAHRSYRGAPTRAVHSPSMDYRWGDIFDGRTYVSVATSGASCRDGLLDAQHDWQGTGQIEELRTQGSHPSEIRLRREVDVLIVNIGANDVDFTATLASMAGDGEKNWLNPLSVIANIRASTGSFEAAWREFEQELLPKLDALFHTDSAGEPKGNLTSVAASIESIIAPRAVLLLEYPVTIFDDADGNPAAGTGLFDTPSLGWGIGRDEARIVERGAELLNERLRLAADEFGWTFVEGIAEQFKRHGYSSGQSYFTFAEDSCLHQRDLQGTMHPNDDGAEKAAEVIRAALGRTFKSLGHSRITEVPTLVWEPTSGQAEGHWRRLREGEVLSDDATVRGPRP